MLFVNFKRFIYFRASGRTRTNNILITSEVQLPIVLQRQINYQDPEN